jgi:hypothetical protein
MKTAKQNAGAELLRAALKHSDVYNTGDYDGLAGCLARAELELAVDAYRDAIADAHECAGNRTPHETFVLANAIAWYSAYRAVADGTEPRRARRFLSRRPGDKTIYIAGGMRGLPEFGFPNFDAARDMLTREGWTVYSPADHDRESGFDPQKSQDMPPDFDVTEAFRWDIETLLHVDAVYFLDGWEASQGANTEHAIAVSIGIDRMYQTPRDEHVYMYLPHVAFKRPKGARRNG